MERKLRLKAQERAHKGKLIVFEGTDGAGKTTLLRLTEKYLESKQGIGQVLVVKQPTDLSRKTKLFQKMMYSGNHEDIDYRAVQLLTMSDRIQHGFEVIAPALRSGKTVLCDRYIYTSLANMLARGYRREKWFYEAGEAYFGAGLCVSGICAVGAGGRADQKPTGGEGQVLGRSAFAEGIGGISEDVGAGKVCRSGHERG